MRRNSLAGGLAVAVLSCCVGCQHSDYARQILSPTYSPGKTDLLFYASGPDMVKGGRINLHRVCEMPDGTPIDVWVINARDAKNQPTKAAATVVVLHSLSYGKGSYPYIGVAERLAKKGYDVVLPDLRHHGRSGGKYITFGVKEKEDIKVVIDKLLAEQAVNEKICVFGVNLGAAVGIQYAAIDDRCKGVVAVAPYQDFRNISRLWVGPALLSDADFEKFIEAAGKMGDFDPDGASALEAAKKLTCPLLLIHGVLDLSVPAEHSTAIYETAGGPKKLVALLGPEAIVLEDWLVGHIDSLITKGLPKTEPTTQPSNN